MKHSVGWLLVALLAVPALRADDAEKPQSPKEQFQALMKEISEQRTKLLQQYQKTKGEEQQKVLEKYFAVGKQYADKVYALAEKNPKDPVATDALFWIVQNGTGSPVRAKALDKITTLVGEIPLKELVMRLRGLRGMSSSFVEAVFKRAEKDEKDSAAGDLLAWVVTSGSSRTMSEKATSRLLEKYPDHKAIAIVCQSLGRGDSPKAVETLKQILEKSPKAEVKAAAAMALGNNLAAKTDTLGDKLAEADKVAAEAEKYFTMVIDQYAKDNAALKKQAETELKALRTIRVGKEAPIISGPDLDQKEFKLSDYRGKVVLLDFWGHW